MVRHVQVVVPATKYQLALKVLKSRSFVHRLEGWPISDERCIIIFKTVEKKMHAAIEILNRYGIGVSESNGTIDIFSLSSTKPRVIPIKPTKKKKAYKMSDSLSYEEIYDIVDGQLHLTFDYLALCSVGAMIAGVGLLTDSSVSVVASMLVSPLMGPIVGMTFSAIIYDWEMFGKSFRNELYGVLLCWAWGAVMGLVISPFIDEEFDMAMKPNTQMTSRGTAEGLLEGLFVAIPSGCGVALGVAGDQINPLVGVAISASLLPPVVNSGLAIAMGIMVWINDVEEDFVYKAHWKVGMYSIILFGMNWLLICIFGYIMFKIKRLSAHKKAPRREQHLHRFDNITDTESVMRRRSDETIRRSSFSLIRPSRTDVIPVRPSRTDVIPDDQFILGGTAKGITSEGNKPDLSKEQLLTSFSQPRLSSKTFGSKLNVMQFTDSSRQLLLSPNDQASTRNSGSINTKSSGTDPQRL